MAIELPLVVPEVAMDVVAGGCCALSILPLPASQRRTRPLSSSDNSILILANGRPYFFLRTCEAFDGSFDSARSPSEDPCPA